MWFRRFFEDRDKLGGAARSPQWPRFRKTYLAGKVCAVCGGTKQLELHHIKRFYTNPELELDPANVLPLCESGANGIKCHIFVGHLGDYKSINVNVIGDADVWRNRIANRP